MPMQTTWTQEEIETVMFKRDIEKKKWRVIAEEMIRPLTSCKRKWDEVTFPLTPHHIRPETKIIPISVLRDRDYRVNLAPRDLSAAFFGDPPVGYSALERA